MAAADFDLIDRFLDFYGRHEGTARQVLERLVEAGFTYCLTKRTGKEIDIRALMVADFARNRKKIRTHCLNHAVEKGGWIEIRHGGTTFLRVYYHPDGTVRYQFGAGNESARETIERETAFYLSLRDHLDGLLDELFLSDAVTLICRFFDNVEPGAYRLLGFIGGERVTTGAWHGDRLELAMERLDRFLDFARVSVQGLDLEKASVKSAMDMMRFYGQMKQALTRVAVTLQNEGHRLEITAGRRVLFRTGAGVAPSPTDAYGPTEIRVDNTLQALAESRRSG